MRIARLFIDVNYENGALFSSRLRTSADATNVLIPYSSSIMPQLTDTLLNADFCKRPLSKL
jgi:hypothetical protein